MRGFRPARFFAVLAIAWLGALAPAVTPALADDLIPDRRFVLSENTDMPGGDLTSIFDTTLDACERACLTNRVCTAFTFNTRNGSCFPKSGAGGPETYQGAYSGIVIEGDAKAEALAATPAAELTFVGAWELPGVTAQAANLANAHVTNGYTADEHLSASAGAEASSKGEAGATARASSPAVEVAARLGEELAAAGSDGLKEQVKAAMNRLERDLIERALHQTQGNVTHAARLLKISRKGLQLKMKELGLRERDQD